jgi:glucose-1-phosphate adenylyltransferase
LAGKYRLIDVPISNCLHAGIEEVYVLTQFLSASLHRHIHRTYRLDLFSQGFVSILAAEETLSGMDWYQGTADAVRKNLSRFTHSPAEDILILSGDHLYRMDYGDFVEYHREQRADVTIAGQLVSIADASRFGILKMDEDGRATSFHEKPSAAELPGLEWVPGGSDCMASMGIYVFRSHVLRQVLAHDDMQDFGSEVIPAAIQDLRVYVFPFEGYWVDIGTIRAFYKANLALTRPDPPFDFYDVKHPIYTRPRFLPSSRADGCRLQQTVLAEGCLMQEADIRESVIGLRSIIGPGVTISRSVMMGADFYETPERKVENRRLGLPDVGIGRGTSIEGAIIDKNARIGEGVIVRGRTSRDDMVEEENYVIRDGLVVIPKNAVIPDGMVI